jgi:hypothetical protein
VAQALDSLTLADLIPPRAPAPELAGTDDFIHLTPIAKPITQQGRNAANL